MDTIMCENCQELIEFKKPYEDYFDVTCKECGAVHEVEAEEHIEYTYNSTGQSSSAASMGYRSSADAIGKCTAAISTGAFSRAKAGQYGCLALAFRVIENDSFVRDEMRCARVGVGDGSDGMLKADTWYMLDLNGEFMECSTAG